MIPDNARTLRITAAAGTELAGPYSYGTVTGVHVPLVLPVQKRFTTRRAFFPHAAWLDQAPAHCPIFLTAASRRSLVRVSVPVWGAPLSGPLTIGAMVGRYPAIELMVRMAIRYRPKPLDPPRCRGRSTWGINPGFPGLFPRNGQVPYALRTRAPVADSVQAQIAAPRLACVRPAASVHPEPGSNSSSLCVE